MTVGITRTDLGSRGLRLAAARSHDAAAARRMLALALVLEGHNRTEAAREAGMRAPTVEVHMERIDLPDTQGDAGLIAATVFAECWGAHDD